MRIYIAGSISDGGTLPPEEQQNRVLGFNKSEEELRMAGFDPINPARRGADPALTWLHYMRASLHDIADCDGIALLPSWRYSRGAKIEKQLADDLGLPAHPLSHWLKEAYSA